MSRILQILYFIIVWSFSSAVFAQEPLNHNWGAEKILGVRFMPYPAYNGFPFLNDSWDMGYVEFADGEISDSLNLRYSSLKDEVVYYNKEIATQIVIDKTSLKGFSYVDNKGKAHYFRKQFFDGYMQGDRYFELLSSGKTDLLAFRRVSATSTSPYYDESGILKNMTYSSDYQYFFYSREKGYSSVRLNSTSLVAKFERDSQKAIKKLLRKNRIRIDSEESFIMAWKIIESAGYDVSF